MGYAVVWLNIRTDMSKEVSRLERYLSECVGACM